MNNRILVATVLTLVCGLTMISPMKSANAAELTRTVRVINHAGVQTGTEGGRGRGNTA